MARHDEDGGRAALAEALEVPFQNGSLEAALHSARAVHMRHPGDGDAKRLVEALELLMAQVWFGGADDSSEIDPRYVTAAQHLESLDFDGALARYEEIVATDGADERASRLSLGVRVVNAARAGWPLPALEPSHAPAPQLYFQETTRIADDGELPLSAFEDDELTTAALDTAIPEQAYRDEPTRQLRPGDYELYDPDADPMAVNRSREVTRIAQDGELPLEEVHRALREEASAPGTEQSLVLDITVEELEEAALATSESSAPTRLASAIRREVSGALPTPVPPTLTLDEDDGAPPPKPPPLPAPHAPEPSGSGVAQEPSSPRLAGPSNASRGPAVAPARPPSWIGPAVLTDALPTEAAPRYDSSEPPPQFPPADRLPIDPVHAPLDTGEVALPTRGRWEIREPGGEPEPQEQAHPSADTTWAGLRAFGAEPATFEPGVEPVADDTWGERTDDGASSDEQRAELLVERGELGEALRIYQDLAANTPDQPRLWDRVKEIATMLQSRTRR